jgi:hypothetical protein
MHIKDLNMLMTAVKTAENLPLYSSIIMLKHLTHLPLTYVKSTIHINAENYKKHKEIDGQKSNMQLHKYWTARNFINMHKYEDHVHTIALSQH